ncbi:MAG: hypothetical protein AAF456_10755, partial [Planctomycetota bacterium]
MDVTEVQHVTVSAPSRIPCGLFSTSNDDGPSFGGMGVMLRSPRTEISITPSSQFEVSRGSAIVNDQVFAELRSTITTIVDRWLQRYGSIVDIRDRQLDDFPVRVTVNSIPDRHYGFGSGTQIALSVAAALFGCAGQPLAAPEEIAPVVERGRRSAIGTYGFFTGGLLIDQGKVPGQSLAPLDFQIAFPEEWPIFIAYERTRRVVSGLKEKAAFERLEPTPDHEREHSISIVRDRIVPAITSRDYDRFAAGLYEFG